MKICDNVKVEKKSPEPIMGHLYQHEDGRIWFCAYDNRLVGVESGTGWAGNRGFDDAAHKFTDVTEEYCLQRVEES